MLRRVTAAFVALILMAASGGVAAAVAPAPAASVAATQVLTATKIKPAKVTITGKAVVGSKLRAKTTKWKPSGTKLSYSWLRNGKKISGATKSSYTLTAKDRGKRISVKVTGTKRGAKKIVRTSAKTKAVAPGKISPASVRIVGAPVQGETLSAATSAWRPAGVKLAYRWTRDGATISGATRSTYKVVGADLGRRIAVTVTGTKTGYTKASRTSAATALVTSFYDKKFGTFPTITYTGNSDDIIDLGASRTAVMVTATHTGRGHFSIVAREADYGYGDLLVNEIGFYTGTTATGLSPYDDETGMLEVDADGPWEITVAPISAAPMLPSSGTGDGVYRYDGRSGARAISHRGSSNFIVKQHYQDVDWGNRWTRDLLVNEIGSYSGNRFFQAGPSIVTVEADGSWDIY